MRRNDILEQKEQILEWINEKKSKAFICRFFKCKPETLDSYLTKMDIIYNGNQGGQSIKKSPYRVSAIDYSNSDTCKSGKLKKKLIEEGYNKDICVKCGNDGEWMGESITLELDHIDGDRFNNNFENLRILCPNCHSQTPTFRGRGQKRKLKYYCECGNEKQKLSKVCLRCHKIRFK